jgi:hypothetical protein
MTTAVLDMETAYSNAAGKSPSDASKINRGAGLIGGMTLEAGVYVWNSAIDIRADIYLEGGPCDVFILQTSKNVLVANGVKVFLIGAHTYARTHTHTHTDKYQR